MTITIRPTNTGWRVTTDPHWDVWSATLPTMGEATDYAARIAAWQRDVELDAVTFVVIDRTGAREDATICDYCGSLRGRIHAHLVDRDPHLLHVIDQSDEWAHA